MSTGGGRNLPPPLLPPPKRGSRRKGRQSAKPGGNVTSASEGRVGDRGGWGVEDLGGGGKGDHDEVTVNSRDKAGWDQDDEEQLPPRRRPSGPGGEGELGLATSETSRNGGSALKPHETTAEMGVAMLRTEV